MVTQNPFDGWAALDPKSLPDRRRGPFLTTNNPSSRNAHGQPSHVYLVGMFHATDGVEGPVTAFDGDGYTKIWGCKLFRPVFETPAAALPNFN